MNQKNLKVENGIGNITVEDLNRIVELNGDWEFYPNELLTPQEIKNLKDEVTYIKVPKVWKNYVDTSNGIEIGTYRAVINVPKDAKYALRFNSIHYDNKVYINGKRVGGLGDPEGGLSRNTLSGRKFNVYGSPSNGQLEVVIQVGHQFKISGGIVKPILFGTAEKMDYYTFKAVLFECLVVAATFMIGIYCFLRSVLQRKWRDDIFFAFFCFAQGIYFSTQNEKLLLYFFPSIGRSVLWEWQFLSLISATAFLMLFVYVAFKKFANKRNMIFIISLMAFSVILLFTLRFMIGSMYFDNLTIFTLFLIIGSAGLGVLFILITSLKGIFRDKERFGVLILPFSAFACYYLSIGLKNIFEADVGHWPVILQIILIISIAYAISFHGETKNKKIQLLTQEVLSQQKLKDGLVLKISESMKQPIAEIMQSTKGLMDGRKGPLNPEQQESVNVIDLSVNKVQRLIADLVSGIQFKGHIFLTAQSTILKMLNELVYEISFFIKDSKKVQIKTEFSEQIPVVYTDIKLLKEAIFNILHNAVKYTDQGEIFIRTYEKGPYYYIEIKDTGIGIDPKQLDNVFNLFYQSNVPQNRKEELGIGLSVAKQYINVMNGDVYIDSEVGKGTTVTIQLPIQHKEENYLVGNRQKYFELSKYEFPLHLHGEKDKTILVIDENKEELLFLAKMLEKNGYNVFAYNSQQDVMKVISENQIDLIVMDIYMPKDFIFNFVGTVRKFYQKIELPIILLSKTDRLDDVKMLFEKGINVIKRWPIIEEEFVSHIESLMSMKVAVDNSVKQELRAYHTQITPHFLYNTLNTIIGLSYVDVEKMREALEHLSVFFRAKLDYYKQQSMVSIEEELELVEAYVLIEKLRFNHLNVEYNIDSTIDIEIPSLTLQPLVENAIQHGLINKEQDAKLYIGVQRVDDSVEIVIEDNGIGMSKEQQRAILQGQNQRLGFLNPFNKIRLFQNSRFELHSELDKGTRITIYLRDTNSKIIE